MDMIRAEDIKVSFGKLDVLKGVSLAVKPQEVVCIIGPSGAGKSTFLRALNHLEHINNGSIYIEDRLLTQYSDGVRKLKISSKERRDILLEVGMVFQRFNLFPHKTALQNTMIAPMHVLGKTKEEARQKGIELLNRVGLGDKLDSYPGSLSGGQQQRVAIARALAMNPEVMLFDEPTSALDPIAEIRMYEQYNEISEGKTAVFISHRLASTKFCERIFFLEKGGIAEQGSHDELMEKNGKYRELFEIQSRYYRKQEGGREEC